MIAELTNVAKYAHATSATVSVASTDGDALVEVCDDGVGGADPRLGSSACAAWAGGLPRSTASSSWAFRQDTARPLRARLPCG